MKLSLTLTVTCHRHVRYYLKVSYDTLLTCSYLLYQLSLAAVFPAFYVEHNILERVKRSRVKVKVKSCVCVIFIVIIITITDHHHTESKNGWGVG